MSHGTALSCHDAKYYSHVPSTIPQAQPANPQLESPTRRALALLDLQQCAARQCTTTSAPDLSRNSAPAKHSNSAPAKHNQNIAKHSKIVAIHTNI